MMECGTLLVVSFYVFLMPVLTFSDDTRMGVLSALRCTKMSIQNGYCNTLDGIPVPEHLDHLFDGLDPEVRAAFDAGDLTQLEAGQLVQVPPTLLYLLPVEQLATLNGSHLGSLLLAWPADTAMAVHLLSSLLTPIQRSSFLVELEDKEISEAVQEVIARTVSIWEPNQELFFQHLFLISHFPPEYLDQLPHNIAIKLLFYVRLLLNSKECQFTLSPTMRRMWAHLIVKHNYPTPISNWTFTNYNVFAYLLTGLTPDELQTLNASEYEIKHVILNYNFSALQARSLFRAFYSNKTLTKSDFQEFLPLIGELLPEQMRMFPTGHLNDKAKGSEWDRVLNYLPQISVSLATNKQLADLLMLKCLRDRRLTSAVLSIWVKCLGQLVHSLPPSRLAPYAEAPPKRFVLQEIESAHLSHTQAYLLTGRGKALKMREPSTIMSLYGTKLLSALPTSKLLRQDLGRGDVHSVVFHHLLSHLPGGNTPRSLALLGLWPTLLAEPEVLESLFENPEASLILGLLSSRHIADSTVNLLAAFDKVRAVPGFEQFYKSVPTTMMSAMLSKLRPKAWTWTSLLNSSSAVHTLITGLTCADISVIETTDFMSVISKYNQERLALGKVFPKNLQLCCQKKLISYLEVKLSLIGRDEASGLISALSRADIEAIGGFVLASLPADVVKESPYRNDIVSAIGRLSLPELMIASTPAHMQDIIRISIEDELCPLTVSSLFRLGNLSLLVPESTIEIIESSAFKLFVECQVSDRRLCANTAQREAWSGLIVRAFGEPEIWSGAVLATLGDFLVSFAPNDLARVTKAAWANAADTLTTHYADRIQWTQPIPFYKACESLLPKVERAPYISAVEHLVRWRLYAARWQLDTVKPASEYIRPTAKNVLLPIPTHFYGSMPIDVIKPLDIAIFKPELLQNSEINTTVESNTNKDDASTTFENNQEYTFLPDGTITNVASGSAKYDISKRLTTPYPETVRDIESGIEIYTLSQEETGLLEISTDVETGSTKYSTGSTTQYAETNTNKESDSKTIVFSQEDIDVPEETSTNVASGSTKYTGGIGPTTQYSKTNGSKESDSTPIVISQEDIDLPEETSTNVASRSTKYSGGLGPTTQYAEESGSTNNAFILEDIYLPEKTSTNVEYGSTKYVHSAESTTPYSKTISNKESGSTTNVFSPEDIGLSEGTSTNLESGSTKYIDSISSTMPYSKTNDSKESGSTPNVTQEDIGLPDSTNMASGPTKYIDSVGSPTPYSNTTGSKESESTPIVFSQGDSGLSEGTSTNLESGSTKYVDSISSTMPNSKTNNSKEFGSTRIVPQEDIILTDSTDIVSGSTKYIDSIGSTTPYSNTTGSQKGIGLPEGTSTNIASGSTSTTNIETAPTENISLHDENSTNIESKNVTHIDTIGLTSYAETNENKVSDTANYSYNDRAASLPTETSTNVEYRSTKSETTNASLTPRSQTNGNLHIDKTPHALSVQQFSLLNGTTTKVELQSFEYVYTDVSTKSYAETYGTIKRYNVTFVNIEDKKPATISTNIPLMQSTKYTDVEPSTNSYTEIRRTSEPDNTRAYSEDETVLTSTTSTTFQLTSQQLISEPTQMHITYQSSALSSKEVFSADKPILFDDSPEESNPDQRKRRSTAYRNPQINCDAVQMVGIATELTLTETDIIEMNDSELNDCLELFGSMDLPLNIQKLIWSRINKKDIHLAGNLVSAAGFTDVAGLNLSITNDWTLETVQQIGLFTKEKDILKHVANKLLSANKGLPHTAEVSVALGSLICHLPEIEAIKLLSSSSVFCRSSVILGRISTCEHDCLTMLARMASLPLAFGPPESWTSEDLVTLGMIPAGLGIIAWKQLLQSQQMPLAGLQVQALRCLPLEYVQLLSEEQLLSLPLLTVGGFHEAQLAALTAGQRSAVDTVKHLKPGINMKQTLAPVESMASTNSSHTFLVMACLSTSIVLAVICNISLINNNRRY